MKVAAVLFDLDETLVLENDSVERTFLRVAEIARARAGVPLGEFVQVVRRDARTIWQTCPARKYCLEVGISSWEGLTGDFTGKDRNLATLRAWVPGYRVQAWARALERFDVRDTDLAQTLANAVVRERANHHVPYEDAGPALESLRKDLWLGVVTNGAPAIQREKLVRSGLKRWFDVVVVSGEVGVGKPDPRIFEFALRGLGVSATETAMVGDSLERDIIGARHAGLLPVWIDRSGREKNAENTGISKIRTLTELPTLLN